MKFDIKTFQKSAPIRTSIYVTCSVDEANEHAQLKNECDKHDIDFHEVMRMWIREARKQIREALDKKA